MKLLTMTEIRSVLKNQGEAEILCVEQYLNVIHTDIEPMTDYGEIMFELGRKLHMEALNIVNSN